MALEIISQVTSLPEAKAGAYYRLSRDNRAEIEVSTIDIPANGSIQIPMAGKSVNLGDWVQIFVDDYNGSNHASAGSAVDWVQVTDDGVAPPDLWKLLVIGDSFVDSASSNQYTGVRPANENVGVTMKGFWYDAAYVQAQSDYVFRTDMGRSTSGTTEILSRLTDFQARDANLAMIMMGTNNTGVGQNMEQAKLDWEALVAGLRTDDQFQVLIVPCTHRSDADFAVRNAQIDELNTYLITLADSTDGVEIVPVNTEFNTRILVNGDVSDDGLHPNNVGGLLLGEGIAPYLDSLYPSSIDNKTNLAGALTGTGGSLASNATGVVPDGYTGTYANNSTEDGFSYIDRGDGKQWVKIRTNGGTPVNNNHLSKFALQSVACTEGWYSAAVTLEFANASQVSKVRLVANSTGNTYSYCDVATTNPVTDTVYEDGVKYRLRTPTARMENDFLTLYFESTQSEGDDAIMYISDVEIYKVEDI